MQRTFVRYFLSEWLRAKLSHDDNVTVTVIVRFNSVLPSSVSLMCDTRSKKGFGPETKLMSHTEICLLERDSCDEPRKGGKKAEAAASFSKGKGGWRTCEGITVECTRQKVAAAAVLAFGRVTVFCLAFRVVR